MILLPTVHKNTSLSPPAHATYSIELVIEGMRGLAALWVFLYHIAEIIQHSLPALSPIATEGHKGVPVFFAISGYCIFAAAQSAASKPDGAQNFLLRRLKRIYPAYWASIVFVMALPYLIELISAIKTGELIKPYPGWLQYTFTDWFGVVTLSKALIDGADGSAGFKAINIVYWSLAIEVQFYLVVYLALKCGRYWMSILGAISLGSIFAVIANVFHIPAFFLHLWPAFLCGMLVRLAHTHNIVPSRLFGRYQRSSSWVLLICTTLVIAAASTYGDIGFIPTAVAASAVIWCLGGIEHASIVGARRRTRKQEMMKILFIPLALLGQASYSIYLLHERLFKLPEMFVRQLVSATNPLYAISVVLSTLSMCFIFYYLVERRFLNQRSKNEVVCSIAADAERVAIAPR